MKIVSVVGARPQFVKLAPVSEALGSAGVKHVIIHTGQHYDSMMSEVFFSDLRIPAPNVSLGVGSGSHATQTAAMLNALEPALLENNPDWVLVYGDTNSTLAGALCSVKLGLPLVHLEAGLRSFNRLMPEEHNRILTDHASDLLLAPTSSAMTNLSDEGLGSRSVLVGDVMVDVCVRVAARVSERPVSELYPGLREQEYFAATIHRAENTDDPARLTGIVKALRALPLPVVLPVHPRLRERARSAGISLTEGSLIPLDPLPYPEMVLLVAGARSLLTDSGGLQKEALTLGVPCTTLRKETEWEETLEGGWNVLAAEARDLGAIALRARPDDAPPQPYGDGHSVNRVLAALGV